MNESPEYPTILQRIARSDKTAVRDCIDAYGSRIWAMAKSRAASTEEAEIIVEEIFLEIWKNAARFDPERCSEIDFVSLHLSAFNQKSAKRLIVNPFGETGFDELSNSLIACRNRASGVTEQKVVLTEKRNYADIT